MQQDQVILEKSKLNNLKEEKVSESLKKRENKLEKKQQIKQKKNENEKESQSDSDQCEEQSERFFIDPEAIRLLRKITKNYDLTYKNIKNKQELKQYPLRDVPKEDIQYIIRKEKQKQSRHSGIAYDNKAMKRTLPNYLEETYDDEIESTIKNRKEEKEVEKQKPFQELSKMLILDFNNQTIPLQNKMIEAIGTLISRDNDLLTFSLEKQVSDNLDQSFQLMKDRKFNELTMFFNNISPMTAILINLQLTCKIEKLVDEGNTLVQTFMPFLNQCPHYNFIQQDMISIAIRFIHTLVQYFLDTELTIDFGLAMFALKFAPNLIQPIIKTPQDKKVLSAALNKLGFTIEKSKILSDFPNNFLWEDMLHFLLAQNQREQSEYIQIFSKIFILQNPKPFLPQLVDILAQRQIFIECLVNCQAIHLSIQQLIQVLMSMRSLQTDVIKGCLQKNSTQWIKEALQVSEKPMNTNEEMNEEQLRNFGQEQLSLIQEENQKIPIEAFINYSKEIEIQCDNYQHNMYQCIIAQIAASQKQNLVIIEMPTGSGKTWVQALLSLHYIQQEQKVTILEPNQKLKNQTQELLQNLSHDLSIVTIDEFYEYPPQDEVIIVNEYDLIIKNSAFKNVTYGLTGIWQLQNRKAILFTATTNKSTEKIIKHIFQTFSLLKFKSEFEMIQNVSSISQGEIKTFICFENVISELEKDIKQYYTEKPIIIFCEIEKENMIIDMLRQIKLEKIMVGGTQENLKEIRTWKYGVLILNPDDGVGVNTKFAVDSVVLITNQINNETQYLQTQGRSSRARGLCHSIYYSISQQSPQVILKNMKSAHINESQELERLLKVIWAKRNVKQLQETIQDSQNYDDRIKTLKDLEQYMGKTKYNKIIMGFQF